MKPTETSLTNIQGQQFGPYKLVSRLGVGGMAETFVAVRSGPGGFTQRVCLKLVLPFFRESEEFVRLFEREARLAAKLRHRNIVGVIDFGEVDGTSYMALELVDGVDLRALLDAQEGKRLATEFVALLGLELAEALEHAHKPLEGSGVEYEVSDTPGIVHRDISPSNILISFKGEVFLTDFGVAKAISGSSRKQSAVKGKVPYMAPEYLRAEPLDGRADLFSLGVVLFESLAGERPYEGAHDPATIMHILKGEHEPLARLAPDAPPALCQTIDNLLKPDREGRPANATGLIEELDEFAPSARVRRRLGRLVADIRNASGQPNATATSGKTEALPDAPSESTGMRHSTASPPVEWHSTAPPPAELPLAEEPHTQGLPENAAAAMADQGPTASDRAAAPAPKHQQFGTIREARVRESEDEPIALVRPPKRGVSSVARFGGSDEVPAAPRRRAAEVKQPRARSRSLRKPLFIALGALLALGGMGTAAVALWPKAEPTEEAAKEKPKTDEHPGELDEGSAAGVPSNTLVADTPEQELPTEPPNEPERAQERVLEEQAAPAKDKVEVRDEAPAKDEVTASAEKKTRKRGSATAPPVRTGKLTIAVIPWGDVWINGAPWGSAPLRNEPLKPGTYRVSAGQGKPEQTKSIRIEAGERRIVEFDLTQ